MSAEDLPPPDPSSNVAETSSLSLSYTIKLIIISEVQIIQSELYQNMIQPTGHGNTDVNAPQLNNVS